MDTIVVFILFFAALIISIYHGVSLVHPLIFGLVCFILISLRRGFTLIDLGQMILAGAKASLIVLKIFALIGAITAVWRACGTVSFIVYYGIAFMSTQYFILFAFLLSCLVSFLLGTSFGTAGTIGVVLIVLAKSGNVDINTAAGAIIAGAYFGDRCSPMSSSANLVAVLTGTELYVNIKNMFKTSIIPFGLAIIGYAVLSHWNPLVFYGTQVGDEILQAFDIGAVVVLPAVIVLLAAALKIDVKLSMGISILSGMLIGIFIQHQTLLEMLRYIVVGYTMEGSGTLAGIIQGGGLYSIMTVALIVLISSVYSGIFAGTGLLREVEQFAERLSRRIGVYPATILTSIASASFACSQTLAVMLTHQFTNKVYEKQRLSNYRLAIDLENTVIVISALIPWNIAGAALAAALSADYGYIFYAYYLFLVPLTNLFTKNQESTG